MLNDIVPDSVPRADCWAGVISSHSSTGLAPWLGVAIDGIFEGNPPAAARDICETDKGVKGIPTALTSEEAKACEFEAPRNPTLPVAWAKDNAGTNAMAAPHIAMGRVCRT